MLPTDIAFGGLPQPRGTLDAQEYYPTQKSN